MNRILIAGVLVCISGLAAAQVTPIGLWNTIDDATGKPKAEVRIEVAPDPEPNCSKCTDDRKGKPKIGLEIIRGGKKSDDKDVWEGGRILDPNNGTDYRLRLTPIDGGKKLEVRGYVGTPMLGRTQTWVRVE